MICYKKELTVRYETDVCVVGGGPSGVAAAVAAARHGARVFLIESQGCFGGEGTVSLVPAFMPFTDGVNFLAGGIGREIYDRCVTENPDGVVGTTIGVQAEHLKRIYDDLVTAEKIDFLFFTTMVDVIARDGHVEQIVVAAKSGMYAISAGIFIDGTGDGDLCAWAGAPWEKGDQNGHVMPSTLCSMWVNIDWSERKNQAAELERAFLDHVFTQEDRHLPGIFKTGAHTGGGNIGHAFDVDGTNEADLTRGMIDGRKILLEYWKYYREYVKGGFAGAYPVLTGSTLGVRESRRIQGDYVMTIGDFNRRASFDDEIGRFSYPIDDHIAAPTKEAYEAFNREHTSMRYKKGENYGIPYRALLPRELDNVLVAGRCISTDKKMQSSIRVMPCCYITGQAAGTAAALAVEKAQNLRKICVSELQDRLLQMGAFLPNHR